MVHKEITFEEGWSYIQQGFTKLIRIVEGEPEPPFKSNERMKVHTTIYNMCSQKPDYSEQLYDKYREVIEDYNIQTVLPSLREKHDECMLRELAKRWNNHKDLVRLFSRFLLHLERYYVSNWRKIPSLREVGLMEFLLHDEIKKQESS